MEVRSAIQGIAFEHRRRYGYRRITAELRRRGMRVNHKRVARLMREDNLLAVQPRDVRGHHGLRSRVRGLSEPRQPDETDGINQLWVADITYIRLQKEFVYLAVILDAFSRKVVGWALDRTLASRLPIAALQQASGNGSRSRLGSSLGSWSAVRFWRLREGLAKAADDPEHESAGEPL